jgi:uncharacterized protein with ATP-grasp and redox domains
MKAQLACLPCLLEQGFRASRVATKDESLQRDVLDRLGALVPLLDLNLSPAEISMYAYDTVRELTGLDDPFKGEKERQNREALRLEPQLKAIVASAEDGLHAALRLSAAGNIIDLGTQEEFDVEAAIEQVMRESFAVDDYNEFVQAIEDARSVLFMGDNAGEIVFDKALVRELQKTVPALTYCVKEHPIINDATLEDAETVGMTELTTVASYGRYIGTPMNKMPTEFVTLYDASDVIIAKGQGHFETLDDRPENIFFILRAKCPVVAERMGVREGDVGLISNRKRSTGRDAVGKTG